MTEQPLCSQLTVEGKPCQRKAMRGSDRCASHMGRVGRKTVLTPQTTDQLVTMLRAGNYIGVALQAVGVAKASFRNWLTWGRSGHPDFVEFAERIEKALVEGEVRNVAQIATAAQENWQAAAWLLERSHPERWGKVSTRLRLAAEEEEAPVQPEEPDPFAQVDELAARRRLAK